MLNALRISAAIVILEPVSQMPIARGRVADGQVRLLWKPIHFHAVQMRGQDLSTLHGANVPL